MEGKIKRHRSRKKKQGEADNPEMEKKDKKVSLSVKINNYPQKRSVDLKSDNQKKSDQEEFVINRADDQEERHKLKLMWSGVIFFMAIIVIGWVVIFRQSFNVAKNSGQSLVDWQKWNQTVNDVGKNFNATAGQLQTMKNLLNQAAALNASGTNAAVASNNSAVAAPLNQTELNNMKINLEAQLEKAKTNK